MRRSIQSWWRFLRIPTVVALILICATSCNNSEFPTSQVQPSQVGTADATRATPRATIDMGSGWEAIVTIGGAGKVGPVANVNAVRLAATVNRVATYEFGKIHSKYAQTCRSVLPDGTHVVAVLSSGDSAGLRGQSAETRMSVAVNGVTRYTIEYSNRKTNGRWAVYAARYTVHDDSGRQIAHGLLRQSAGRLVSAAERSAPPTVADATGIVPQFDAVSHTSRPSFDETDDINSDTAKIWCADEAALAATTLSILTAALVNFSVPAAKCTADLVQLGLAGLPASFDWSKALSATMAGIKDCVDAWNAAPAVAQASGPANTAAQALSACILAHSFPIIEIVVGGGGGGAGGPGDGCQLWAEGYYDDSGDWVQLDSWTTGNCNRAD